MEIAILGALDRYNYGDLLFPLILHEYLPNDLNIKHYGLIEGDFEEFGSVSANPFYNFFEKYQTSNQKNVIIIAGGSVIGTTASTLYSFLYPARLFNICRNISKLCHFTRPVDKIAQDRLRISWGTFPFCPNTPNDSTLLIYNAVGDVPSGNSELINNLKKAKYLSVRNMNLFNDLQQSVNKNTLALCPDSASVMSEIWPKDNLINKTTEKTKTIMEKFQNGYIVFQAKAKMRWQIHTVKQQLEQLYQATHLPVLLLPIGRAYRHSDPIFLRKLSQILTVPNLFVDVMNIFDIMCLIAYSKLFIGASLHGNITAMSYAVPHLGTPCISKVDQYLKHWDVEPNNQLGTVRPSEIFKIGVDILENADTEKLNQNAERLSKLTHKNLRAISQIIQNYMRES